MCSGTGANVCVCNNQDRSESESFSSLPSEDCKNMPVIFLFSCICDIYFPFRKKLFCFLEVNGCCKGVFTLLGEGRGEAGEGKKKVRTLCFDHRCIFLIGGHI